ncbi:hypothetical protein [Knoellia koreensis]|uniref:Uncharacterized protein n=1 Tax=Knoellia koreensis TaxID=2730921 RepID=A0A849HP09_9MICO|nr:hypothetical protein [Knoellia sp. DB2414S]NNM48141.1 hypothetical protein [Knoellia sp. DB2414S]
MSDRVPDALGEAMQRLYAVEPDEFMALRKSVVAEVKAAGDAATAKEIGQLRKPSLAAWALNVVARERVEVVEDLADVGERMRGAQSRMDTAALTGMRGERDAVLATLVEAATDVAAAHDRRLSPAVLDTVRATGIAALADETAQAAVASGQLTRALSYSGFGEVDLSDAVARTTGGAILTVIQGSGAATRTAGSTDAGQGEGTGADAGAEGPADDVDDADDTAAAEAAREAELERRRSALTAAQEAVEAARAKAEETRERLAVVERQLAKARAADERALEAVTDAVRARKAAEADLAALQGD